MGTSDGARKGWTPERRERQRQRMLAKWADPEQREIHAEVIRQTWSGAEERRSTQGEKVAAKLRRDPMIRFRDSVDYTGDPDGCHMWTKGTVFGYASFAVTPKIRRHATRWLWEQINGPIPDGYEPDHTCHNKDLDCPGGVTCKHRACVNLDHIEIVTQAENLRRMHARKRARRKRGDAG